MYTSMGLGYKRKYKTILENIKVLYIIYILEIT